MSLTQEHISAQLYEEDKWGTKTEYKLLHPNVPYAAMTREIDRGKIAIKLDVADSKVKMNFSQADHVFGFDVPPKEKIDLFS